MFRAVSDLFTKYQQAFFSVGVCQSKPLGRLPSDMTKPLEGQIALVTGASRGIGKGIALQLAENGATVYITGRKPEKSLKKEYSELPTLEKTAEEIRARGGDAITVYCDHADPNDVAKLFEKIEKDNGGQLDILVNNAYSGGKDMGDHGSKPFYELDPLFWDSLNNVGLRNNYVCATLASRMMVQRKSGLIVNISSAGGLMYEFNVAYGVGKAAVDRMSADMAVELAPHKVTILSVWPGAVRTELSELYHKEEGKLERMTGIEKDFLAKSLEQGESLEFTGKCIAAMAADRNVFKKTGKIYMTTDIAREYGLKDIDGRFPMDMRQVSTTLEFFGWPRMARLFPSFLRVPLWAMHFASYKFG